MNDENRKLLVVSPLRTGEFAVILRQLGERDNGQFSIVQFDSEQAAQEWAKAGGPLDGREPEIVSKSAFDDFWQDIEDFACMLDSEPAQYRRERLKELLHINTIERTVGGSS